MLMSDRELKRNIRPISTKTVLSTLADLPIATWSYVDDPNEAVHIGPMARDFSAAFGLGDSDRSIHPVDGNGVVMAAIQALHDELEQVQRDNQRLKGELRRLRRTVQDQPDPAVRGTEALVRAGQVSRPLTTTP